MQKSEQAEQTTDQCGKENNDEPTGTKHQFETAPEAGVIGQPPVLCGSLEAVAQRQNEPDDIAQYSAAIEIKNAFAELLPFEPERQEHQIEKCN